MSAAVLTTSDAGLTHDPQTTAPPDVVPLAAFLDRVAGVLHGGLPERLWIAATVLDVRASAAGHTLELTDPATGRAATLRVFLPAAALTAIRRDLGLPVDPLLLVGMTTGLLVKPDFKPRWHLGGRVEALARDIAASLRSRLLQRVIATLQRERLWDRQHALPRPRDITRIAVVYPAGAAGWGDIAGELRRWERAGLVLVRSCPAPFEGEQAAAALVAALRAAARPVAEAAPDLVLLVRGGGARSALAVLDEEAVARAILACPVPVVCGTGHAADNGTLAGQVSWREADTPSKALRLLADIIGGAARAARSDHKAILAAGATTVLTQAGQLEASHRAVRAAAAQAVAAANHRLLQLWSMVRVETRAIAERSRRLGDGLDHQLAAVLARAPDVLDAAGRALQQLAQTGLERAAARLARTEGGAVLLVEIHARADAVLERGAAALQRIRDEVEAAARRRLDREAAVLDAVLAAVEAGDLGRMLARGLAIVTDEAGVLLPTWAAAAGQSRLRLHFADGVLIARPAQGS